MVVKLITILVLLCMGVVSYSKGSKFQSFEISEKKLIRATGVTVEMCCKDDIPSPQEDSVDLINILIKLDKGKSIQVYDENARTNIVYTCTDESDCLVVPTLQTPSESSNLYARSYCAVKGLQEEIKKEYREARAAKAPFVPLIIEGKPEISVANKKFILLNSCNTNIAEINGQEKVKKKWKSVNKEYSDDHLHFAEAQK